MFYIYTGIDTSDRESSIIKSSSIIDEIIEKPYMKIEKSIDIFEEGEEEEDDMLENYYLSKNGEEEGAEDEPDIVIDIMFRNVDMEYSFNLKNRPKCVGGEKLQWIYEKEEK